MVQKESEGEELLYPLLWQEENQNTFKNSVLSYLGEDISVFYCDYDRQKNAQESFDREYLGLYRKAKNLIETENARPVPPPQDILLNFANLVSNTQKAILFTIYSMQKAISQAKIWDFG